VSIAIIFLTVVLLVFSFVILFGAPYLPTLQPQAQNALDLLDLKPGQTLLELGSGDGRVLRQAARRGIKGIGYELNPLLVLYSQISCFRYRKLITFKCRNYWQVKLPPCDGIYVFLLDKYMQKLDTKIIQEVDGPVKLVSYAFKVPGKKPSAKKSGLMLYNY
jgi:SAM-dependent methyltransferase